MKKLNIYLMAIFLSLTFIPSDLKAKESTESSILSESENEAKAKALLSRLFQIKEMDFSKLDVSEKKSLRMEVRSIRDELKTTSGGIYLSVGAIIIILLILILIA
jgi:hypothetical protein